MNSQSIIILVILVLIIVSQFIQMRKTAELNDKLKKIVNDSNNQYQDVVEINKSLKHIRHDINKQKAIAYDMDSGEPVEAITGVEVIDRIIHFKGKEMAEKNINFSVDAVELPDVKVGNGALISIMANIFDNAIEACSGLEKPWISCTIKKMEGFDCRMVVKNSKRKEAVVDTNGGVTTKADHELHGYGVTIIKELVARNNGVVYMEDMGDSFAVDIML